MPNTGPKRAAEPARPASGTVGDIEALVSRAEAVLERLEALLPAPPAPIPWDAAVAFRWRRRPGGATLEPIGRIAPIRLDDLKNIDRQRRALEDNTRQFLRGHPANNVLLTGARGTGKSSLIKACLNQFAGEGLRLIEVDKADLVDLAQIVEIIEGRSERFIVFCDDLSFEEGETGYKALKVVLDGSLAAPSDHLLVYATSNRRHLVPERMADNLSFTHQDDGEVHPGEVIEERIALSERFGLWLSFYPFRQEEYLLIVAQWLRHYGCDESTIERAHDEALRFALQRGSRSGRIAWQFARDFAGRAAGTAAR